MIYGLVAKNTLQNERITVASLHLWRYTSMQMALIELHDVSKLYGFGDATSVALEEVDLAINQGECVAVMGPSGCGKSTLMNIIGLLDHATHGEYTINGRRAERMRHAQRAKIRRDKIGFIFQSFNLLPRLTALDNVALPLLYRGMTTGKRTGRARDMLERVGLHDRSYYYPRQLSGGQTQCIAIARALVNDPEIIIADEPTGNLDTESSRVVMELLAEIHAGGNTIIFVTHNPELTRYATRVVYMQDGQIKYDERKALGVIGRYARTATYGPEESDEESAMAGVSALMKARDHDDAPAKPKAKRRKTTTRRRKPATKRKAKA